ncbi:pyocin activator PrtN family protein [Pseudomonas aeruginosa]|nr:pyocin activator PrtN family protein [Pseudomonas aeruginosa]
MTGHDLPKRPVTMLRNPHLTPEMFQRKVLAGQIKIPLMRIECSQKSTKGIHLSDLAAYLDKRHAEALEEYQKLNGVRRIG